MVGNDYARKSPVTRKAGPEFADPNYDLSEDWLATRSAIREAQRRHDDATRPSRVLLNCGAARNDKTCSGEMSKSYRVVQMARIALDAAKAEVDILDLSVHTSEYGKIIYLCKGCVSTAMPLCHWPCSCYPNRSLGQVTDWMSELYSSWVAAHGIMIITPVYWYQAPSVLKLVIDRLVSDWLNDMHLVQAGTDSLLDRFIDYFGPHATSHDALDGDPALHEEVRNAARALITQVTVRRNGQVAPDEQLEDPRPK